MIESSSSSPVLSDVTSPCAPSARLNATDRPRETDPRLVTTLYRAASLVRSDASDLAEFEILDLLTPVLDANLTTYALDVIALVRTLHLDELMTGPAPPLDSGRVVTTSSPGRSGPRRDYAHAIVTALRVRLATSDEGGCEEAA